MTVFRSLFTLILVSFYASLSAQEASSNLDWRALNLYLNDEYTQSIDACRNLLKTQADGISKDRTKLILGRALMETKEFDKAITLLSSIELNATFLKAGIPGLIGDSKSEQGNYSEALEFYKKALHAEMNEGVTPNYLFKAYLCAERLGRTKEGQQYIATIIYYFPEYTARNQIEKYVVLDGINPIELSKPSYEQPSELGIGTINGKRIDPNKYEETLDIANSNAMQAAQQMGRPLQKVDENRVWESFIAEKIRTSEYRLLQLHSDPEEFDAYLYATDGYSPQVEFLNSPAFTTDDGMFSPEKLKERVIEMSTNSDPDQISAWKQTKAYYYKKLMHEKYDHFVALVVFVSALEVEQDIENERTYTFKYCIEKEEDEFDIDLTAAEQVAFYETLKLKSDYSILRNKRFGYIIQSEAKPTSKDTLALFLKLNTLKQSFQTTKDDSLFVVTTPNNQLKFYSSGPFSTAVSEGHRKAQEGRYITYPEEMSNTFDKAKTGEIVGPYFFNDQLVIAKVIGRTDEDIEARHILLDGSFTQETANEFLKKVTNENFGQLVEKYSLDNGSKNKGGNLGTFFFGDMVPSFATYCANAPLGQIGLVQSQFGFHIVQVTKRSGKRLPRLAIVQMAIEIGEEGLAKEYENLERIRTNYLTEGKQSNKPNDKTPIQRFNSIAEQNHQIVTELVVDENVPRIYDLNSTSLHDSLLKFMFHQNVSEGDISRVYVDSNKLILAIFGTKSSSGLLPFNIVRNEIQNELRLRKTCEILLVRLKERSPSERQSASRAMKASLNSTSLPQISNDLSILAQAIRAYHSNQSGIYRTGEFGAIYIEVLSEEELNPIRIHPDQIKEWLKSAEIARFSNSIGANLIDTNITIDNRDLLRLGVRN